MTGAKRPWRSAGVLLLLLAGCGAQYRPVVTPIIQTGPAAQPTAYFVALSSPSATSPGLVNLIDAFGDTILAQATLSNNPFAFTLNAGGTGGFNLNGNETAASVNLDQQPGFSLNSYLISSGSSSTTGLRTEVVSTSTIPALAYPFNAISTATALYLIEPYTDPVTLKSTSAAAGKAPDTAYVGELPITAGSVPALQQEIPVAPNPVNFAGTSAGQTVYVLSQGNSTNGPLASADACNTPSSVSTNGEADAIAITTNTISTRIPLGICPVYGVESPDFLRAYVLNRGGSTGTVTVINGQTNALDTTISLATPATVANPASTGAGPVFADLYAPSSLLVTANYDSNSVSVVNVPTDVYFNDAPNFGKVVTISLGANKGPVALTILRDGSKAYVANQLDGTISVINLSNFTVTKTISLGPCGSDPVCHPRSIASVLSSPYSAVFVASPGSNSVTVINTETDTVAASVLLPAHVLSVNSTTQNASSTNVTNSIVNSNAGGLGVPCAVGDTSPFCPQ